MYDFICTNALVGIVFINFLCIKKTGRNVFINFIAQSAVAVEYTDWTSVEE